MDLLGKGLVACAPAQGLGWVLLSELMSLHEGWDHWYGMTQACSHFSPAGT